jgi:SAM-dependent methyltransferase
MARHRCHCSDGWSSTTTQRDRGSVASFPLRPERRGTSLTVPAGAGEFWQSGSGYESYIGRWSRPVGRRFIAWLEPRAGLDWLDVGCGTGALTAIVLEAAEPGSVVGIDPSSGFIEHARSLIGDPRVRFFVGDAQQLPVEDASADVAVSGLVLNFVPDPGRGVAEMRRATRTGGTIAAYVWDLAAEMQLIRRFWDAAIAEDPAAADLDEAGRFPLAARSPIEALFRAAGLESVETVAIDVPTVFHDFDDLWTPFLAGQGPGPVYLATLRAGARDRLRERLRGSLSTEADGSIHLIARAWAVRGRNG